MITKIFSDNWILQNVSELLKMGLSTEKGRYIKINEKKKSYDNLTISHALIQIKCLFSLLHDIVLSDQIMVDKKFSDSWKRYGNHFNLLIHSNVLSEMNFDVSNQDFLSIRSYLVNEICINEGLETMQRVNELAWKENGEVVDNLFSQIIWGGAGYLARSSFSKIPYSGHPLRKYIFSQTMLTEKNPSFNETLNWIQNQRVKLFSRISPEREVRIGIIPLPPIIIEIIENSHSIEEIFSTALQLRDKYSGFRKWLTEYQRALNDENTNALIKYKKLLNSVETNISSKISDTEYSKATITLGTSWINIPLNLVNPSKIKHKFGVRSTLNKMILLKKGQSTFEKFLKYFGEDKSNFGKNIEHSILTFDSF